VKVAWLSMLDVNRPAGGGELAQREVIAAGRRRGHAIVETPFLRGRLQRALRKARFHRRLRVDWTADLFVLANIRNHQAFGVPFPPRVLERALNTGRAIAFQDAWVDTCLLDMPCGGDPSKCPAECSREWANDFYGRCARAAFVSPMQAGMVQAVIERMPPVIIRPPFVDPSRFRDLGLDRDIDVLYVGTIKEEKGYDELVARFGADRLTFVGPDALGRPIGGTYLGARPYAELPSLYNRARVFAHLPRWHEPMGRAVMEAALCGCELVLNDRVGVTSFAREQWTDPAIVATALDRLWEELEAAAAELPVRWR
jgi:glycosyltransferase involved in cell wall biosynthesis